MITLTADTVATLLAPASRDRVVEVTVRGYSERDSTFSVANGSAPYWNGTAVAYGTLTIGNISAHVLEPMYIRVSCSQKSLSESANGGTIVGERSRRFFVPSGESLYAISTSTPTVAVDEVLPNGIVKVR